jgi:hypothetical protein
MFSLLPSLYSSSSKTIRPNNSTEDITSADDADCLPRQHDIRRGNQIKSSTTITGSNTLLGRFQHDEDQLAAVLLPLSTIAMEVDSSEVVKKASGSTLAALSSECGGAASPAEGGDSGTAACQVPSAVVQLIVSEATLETVGELLSDSAIAAAVVRKATARSRAELENRMNVIVARATSKRLTRRQPPMSAMPPDGDVTGGPLAAAASSSSSSAFAAQVESQERSRKIKMVQEAEAKVNRVVGLIRQEMGD